MAQTNRKAVFPLMPTILIVEDHDLLRSSLRDWLQNFYPSFQILEAVNGEESVAIAYSQEPAVILMDIGLPGIDGLEATRLIKQHLPEAQVVVLLVEETRESTADACNAGADACMAKSGAGTRLIGILDRLLFHKMALHLGTGTKS